VEAAESLGSSLDISTDRDSTRITMSVTRDHFAEAMDIPGRRSSRASTRPNQEAWQRETDRVKSLARTSAAWAASMALWNKLFEIPAAVHPYSRYDALARDLDTLRLEDCRAWHKREFSPKNAVFVVAGDVDPKEAKDQVTRALGAWSGEAPEMPSFTAPTPRGSVSVLLVDRPSSTQAEVYAATLAGTAEPRGLTCASRRRSWRRRRARLPHVRKALLVTHAGSGRSRCPWSALNTLSAGTQTAGPV
jgi:predicted Zn-dependent peptidase